MGSYQLFRDIGVQGGYAFSVYRVGSPINTTASGAIQFFDTNVHTWSVGPRLQMTKLDSVALVYQQSLINQSQALTQTEVEAPVGSTSINTNTQTVTASYNRATPSWTFAVGGGITLIEPASKAFPTGNITISNNPERSTTVQMTLSRQATAIVLHHIWSDDQQSCTVTGHPPIHKVIDFKRRRKLRL